MDEASAEGDTGDGYDRKDKMVHGQPDQKYKRYHKYSADAGHFFDCVFKQICEEEI